MHTPDERRRPITPAEFDEMFKKSLASDRPPANPIAQLRHAYREGDEFLLVSSSEEAWANQRGIASVALRRDGKELARVVYKRS